MTVAALRPLPIDADGAVVADAGTAVAMVLTAAHFQLGIALSPARRDQAVSWATGGGLVIEDDYDGEFRYDRRPLGAVQGLDTDAVAYVGTASKSLAPGVHLAWLVVPPRLLDAVVEAKRLSDGFPALWAGGLLAAEPAVVSRAARAGLTLSGLVGYRVRSTPDSPAALVIGYGTPPEHAYARTLELLCEALPRP